MTLKFSDLLLEPRLQSAINRLNYQDCTPIQAAVIPLVQEGKDVSGLAQTGTGKTAAFLVPLMDRLLKGQIPEWKGSNFILILVPTRELAEQVYENCQKLSEESGLKSVAVYGGTGYDKQKDAFRNQVDFVVATPGRLIDLYKDHVVDLKQVRAIVFDEADRMFDMGFKDDMKFILQRVPEKRQFLVFSATLNFDVLNTAYQFGAEPIEVNVSRDQARAENVKDQIFHVGQEEKPAYLVSLLNKHKPKQTIIFSNFKNNVERVAQFLTQNGKPAMAISSLLTQAQRNKVLELFKAENEQNILVATDVAARGLDIKGVDMVINYELPMDAESYVHRIGRTGRAGAEGQAFSLVSDRDVDSLARIEEYLKHKLDAGWMEDSELTRDLKPFPSEHRERRFDRQPREGGRGGPPRDGRGPREGSRDRGPRRPPRDGDRPQARSAQEHSRSAQEQRPPQERGPEQARTAEGQTKPVTHQHGQNRRFDRNRTPRDGNRPFKPGQPGAQARPTNGQGSGHGHTQGGKPGSQGPRRPNRPYVPNKGASAPSRVVAAKKPNAVGKIAGFIKKIFGS